MIKEAISKLINLENLTQAEAEQVMTEIMSGQATQAQIGSFITALRMKGETADEITGCARVMRKFATPIHVNMPAYIENKIVLDTCGTGGDLSGTFNISTASALVIASCGQFVAKHGNRSVSSLCGSADVLEALGVNINLSAEKVEACITATGIGFLFATTLHGAMKHAIGPRREIGIRTIFNILGPLTNPAGASAQILGVYNKSLTPIIASVLNNLGTKRAWVVHGEDGLDEISISAPTYVSDVSDGQVKSYVITPEQYGFSCAPLSELKGGDAKTNADIIRDILSGQTGPKRDIVLFNAAAGLMVSGKVSGIIEGIIAATAAIDSGKSIKQLDLLIKTTNELSHA